MERSLKNVLFCFRMVPATFEKLLGVVNEVYQGKMQRGDSPVIDPRKSLLMTISYLAQKSTLLQIADRFNVADSTVLYESEYVISLLGELKDRFIVWPRERDCAAVASQFYRSNGNHFPGKTIS